MLRIATVNVNGLRAAARKGLHEWMAECGPDIVTLQEVRAPDEMVADLLGEGWNVVHAEAGEKGRAGVAVASRLPIIDHRHGDHSRSFAGKGRWIEADIRTGKRRRFTVISAYAHTGDETSPTKMREKLDWFAAATDRLGELRDEGGHVLLTGDLNVAHREADLKNWKGNLTSAGFLPEERAWFDRWFDELGWVDVVRAAHPEQAGPYSWWSFRGKAFDNDAGWRIDYQIASPDLARRARHARVDRAPSYDTRWSDHAPVVVDYEL
ncbi:MAG: exodeoxyribonuclease III [Acidimicrobiia bacterium]|nr:exodeoxyribonuclease III [Acidimicrobiia bacterium]